MSKYYMQVPAYMYNGGDSYDDDVFGGASAVGGLYLTDPDKEIAEMKEDIYTRVFPNVYLNRLIRLEYDAQAQMAKLSDDVVSIGSGWSPDVERGCGRRSRDAKDAQCRDHHSRRKRPEGRH